MKLIQTLAIYVVLTILDGIIMIAMFFLILEVISGVAGAALIHLMLILSIIIFSSIAIQFVPTQFANRFLTISNRSVMGLRYAYVIPYAMLMFMLARATSSYLVFTMIVVVPFIAYLKLTKSSVFEPENKRHIAHHVFLSSLIFFSSLILVLLSALIR